MKIFCSYAFTGEDVAVITRRMKIVVDTLRSSGHDAYCNLFDEKVDELQKQDDIKGIFREAFDNLNEADAVVAIITSPNKSIGQIMEIGVALSQKKPVYLFEHTSAEGSTYIPKLVSTNTQWTNNDDLEETLKLIK
ncbi:MAG: nucleoside 2-deoxyribosyltransferase [Candidatus Saccharimonadales bacterium]|jgi:nucleoside 2-deoxyribosyltransferase